MRKEYTIVVADNRPIEVNEAVCPKCRAAFTVEGKGSRCRFCMECGTRLKPRKG
jgi:predicted amidophosphoribosyltransferase